MFTKNYVDNQNNQNEDQDIDSKVDENSDITSEGLLYDLVVEQENKLLQAALGNKDINVDYNNLECIIISDDEMEENKIEETIKNDENNDIQVDSNMFSNLLTLFFSVRHYCFSTWTMTTCCRYS